MEEERLNFILIYHLLKSIEEIQRNPPIKSLQKVWDLLCSFHILINLQFEFYMIKAVIFGSPLMYIKIIQNITLQLSEVLIKNFE